MKRICALITAILIIIPLGFVRAEDVTTKKFKYDAPAICGLDAIANDYFSLADLKKNKIAAEFEKALKGSDGDSIALSVRLALESARKQYHDAMKCVFDVATIQLLGAPANIADNIKKDDLPNVDAVLKTLTDTDKVCAISDDTKFRDIVEGTGPENFVPKLLNFYNSYSAFINEYLMKKLELVSGGQARELSDVLYDYNSLKMIMENEEQDSIVALDTAMQTLKQMRLAFVMHVRFECILRGLKFYQTITKNIRAIVTVIPSAFENASMHK